MQTILNLKSAVFQNAFILLFLQVASYVVPFLLLPYLARILGVEGFGELATLWAASSYIQILIDFGFFVWATKECATLKDDTNALSLLFACVFVVKVAIAIFSLLLMFGFSLFFNSSPLLYFYMWIYVLMQALMPNWFFQGVQKTLPVLIFGLSAQIIAAVMTVLLVDSAQDILYAPLSQAVTWGIFTVFANIYVYKKYNLAVIKPTFLQIKTTAVQAWHLFAVNLSVAINTNMPAFILATLATKGDVAVFVGAQKIVSAVQGLFSPIFSALFPRIAEISKHNLADADIFLKKTVIFAAIFVGGMGIMLFLFADFIVEVFLGVEFKESASLLQIMAMGPLLAAMSTIFYSGYIVVRNHAKTMKSFFTLVNIAGLIIGMTLVVLFSSYGAAWSYLVLELIICVGLFIKVSKVKRA